MTAPYSPAALRLARQSALDLASHGLFWTGVRRHATEQGTIARGQACVEYFIPRQQAHPIPLVLIHGGGQGTDYLAGADGRPGWLHYFVRAGFAVYVVDLPGHGRSPSHAIQVGETAPPASFEFVEAMFAAPRNNPHAWPQAALHSQWPDATEALDNFVASGGPLRVEQASAEIDGRDALVDILAKVGRAVLITHSGGAPVGWLAADLQPENVAAVVAVEPFGPPVVGMGPMSLPWGVTATAPRFEPTAADPSEMQFVERAPEAPDVMPCMVQADPPRRLPGLAKVPVLVVTAEASWMAGNGHGVVDFLRQAGVATDHLRLGEAGIHGNGHLVMLEMNNQASAEAISAWLESHSL